MAGAPSHIGKPRIALFTSHATRTRQAMEGEMPRLDGGFSSRTHYVVGVVMLLAVGAAGMLAFMYFFW